MLGALCEWLMGPEPFRTLAVEFTATWNRLQAEASAGLAARRAELDRVQAQFERLVDALAEGTPAAAVRTRMAALEARRLELGEELASAEAPAPRLHPTLAEVYRQRVAQLTEVLAEEDGAEARELVRSLVEAIRLVPETGKLRIEVCGEPAATMPELHIPHLLPGQEGGLDLRAGPWHADLLATRATSCLRRRTSASR